MIERIERIESDLKKAIKAHKKSKKLEKWYSEQLNFSGNHDNSKSLYLEGYLAVLEKTAELKSTVKSLKKSLLETRKKDLETRDREEKKRQERTLELELADKEKQRDHEREMKIIDHEIARENRLATEATAKVAATAQEQASQSLDDLLKGLQGNE